MKNPFDPGYYESAELRSIGFRKVGANVRIAKNCTIIGVENISFGDNVRIDAYCSLIASGTGWIEMGSFIHIAGYCLLSGGDGIRLEDFVGVSHGGHIYSRTDDFTGEHLTGPTVPPQYIGLQSGTVILERHVITGSGSVILPHVTIGEGSAVGALTVVTKDLPPWGIFAGSPARKLRDRSTRLLKLEAELREQLGDQSQSQ